ncbi:unnamed protein product [Pichia kudriavzevii]
MSTIEDDVFYEQDELDFEELIEKNMDSNFEDDENIDKDLLSDLEEYEDEEVDGSKEKIKREERLQQKMNMTKNPLTSVSLTATKDEDHIKRRVAMLCSALGGFDLNPPQDYILGIEAAGCLRDIKRLLKVVDEEKNVHVVASACHDSGLLINDLVPIVVQFGTTDVANADPDIIKLLLSCLELITKLMTPITLGNDDVDDTGLLKLKRAQIEYKHRLLHYKKGKIFKYLVALIIPVLQLERSEVTHRDNIILNLCLTLFTNILRIKPSDANTAKKNKSHVINVFQELPPGILEEDISLEVVLEVYRKYKILPIVQTIASNLSNEFESRILGTACLDFYYYSFVSVDPKSLVDDIGKAGNALDPLPKSAAIADARDETNDRNVSNINDRLRQLKMKEKENIRSFKSKSSTRHAKFGSLISVQDRKNGTRVLSGQDKLRDTNIVGLLDKNVSKIESGKIFNRINKKENEGHEKIVRLNIRSRELLSKFVQDFIENGFPIVFREMYSMILEGLVHPEEKKIYKLDYDFFFVVNWILRFEMCYQSVHKRGLKNSF